MAHDKKDSCCAKTCSKPDYVVCTCMGVMRSEIEQAIVQGATTFQALSDQLGVGTGCSSCIDEVCQILAEVKKRGQSKGG